ncbi:MAG: hypothetical protein ACOC6F_03015, partial [bacterium]
MNQFYSNYKVTAYARYPPAPYKGKGWHIGFEEDTTPGPARTQAYIDGTLYPAKIVVIHASSFERAQYVADMIYASLCLARGGLPPFGRTWVVPMPFDSPESPNEQGHPGMRRLGGPTSVQAGGLPLALMIAAKASYRRAYQYALFKHLLSHEIFSTEIIDLDPSHWQPTQFVFHSAEHHVHCAYAIVAAYAVLEELSLE